MRITTRHPRSKFGVPVILDDRDRVCSTAVGIRMAMDALGWDKSRIASETNSSPRTVEGWFQGRAPGAAVLNVLADALLTQESYAK